VAEGSTTHTFSVEDLEAARIAAGVEFEPGDVVVLRSGFLTWYTALTAEEKIRIADRTVLTACGIEHTEAMAEYAWNSHAVAFVSDTPSLEVWPMDRSEELFPFGSLHRVLLAQFGMAIGELWWLDDLADACASDGVYEFMLSSTPWRHNRAIGSPANAIAIK
jgi:kynurenine formamidase